MTTRVLHIIEQLGIGGCEKQLLELCRRLDRSRFDIGICYYTYCSENLVSEFESLGVPLYFINKKQLTVFGFFLALRGTIRNFKPDVVNTWLYSANFWGRAAATSCGKQNLIACDRSGATRYNLVFKCLEPLVASRTRWVVNSRALADRLGHILRVSPGRIRVIHNAVEFDIAERDVSRLAIREELGMKPDQVIVLAVGRLTYAKNYPMLFNVARTVLAQNGGVRFVVAGHGELESELQELKRLYGLGDKLVLLGLRNDIPRLLAAADLFCMTSWFEGFPNAAAEAMSAGLPVICTHFPGAEEIVKEGTTGYLVEINDIQNYSKKVLDCLADVEMRTSMGIAAASWVQEHLKWERVMNEMEHLYLAAP